MKNMVVTLGHKLVIDIKHMFTTNERMVHINGTHLTESRGMQAISGAWHLFPPSCALHLSRNGQQKLLVFHSLVSSYHPIPINGPKAREL
nr:hypothetical protein [Aeromonas allosaccharophila]